MTRWIVTALAQVPGEERPLVVRRLVSEESDHAAVKAEMLEAVRRRGGVSRPAFDLTRVEGFVSLGSDRGELN